MEKLIRHSFYGLLSMIFFLPVNGGLAQAYNQPRFPQLDAPVIYGPTADQEQALEDFIATETPSPAALSPKGNHQWKFIAPKYVYEFNPSMKLMAIHDLSVEPIGINQHTFNTILGSIGFGQVHLKAVWTQLKDLYDKNQEYSFLAELAEKLPQSTSEKEFNQNWVKDLKWKNSPPPSFNQYESSHFSLQEIDWSAHVDDQKKFKKNLAKINTLIKDLLYPSSDQNLESIHPTSNFNILDQLSIINHSQGVDVFFHRPKTREQRTSSPAQNWFEVANFQDHQSLLKLSARIFLIEKTISQLVSTIPGPLGGVVGYAISRWFRLFEQQKSIHLHQLLEVLQLNLINQNFQFISKEEIEIAMNNIYLFNPSAKGMLKNFFKKNSTLGMKKFKKQMDLVNQQKTKLDKSGKTYTSLNPWLVELMDQNNKKNILILAAQSKDEPLTLLILENDHRELLRRHSYELVYGAFSFLNLGPLSTLAKYGLKEVMGEQIDQEKIWEGRLAVYFEEQEYKSNQNDGALTKNLTFKKELHFLHKRQLNPFELSPEMAKKRVLEQKDLGNF
jgi:hypothetical protein